VCSPEAGWVASSDDWNDDDPTIWQLTAQGCVPAPVLKCADGKVGCDPVASCFDQPQGAICVCPGNFSGDGHTCVNDYRFGLRFGRPDQDEQLCDLSHDSQNNLWLSAEIYDTQYVGNFSLGTANRYSLMLAKFSSTGKVLWAQSFLGTEYESALANEPDGSVWWVGYYFGGTNLGGADLGGDGTQIFVNKRNPDGSHAFSKGYGGPANDMATAVAVHGSSVFVAGSFEETINLSDDNDPKFNLTSAGGQDVFVMELDQQGKHVWSTSFGGPEDDSASAITAGPNGIFVAANYQNSVKVGAQSFAAGKDEWSCVVARFDYAHTLKYAQGFSLSPDAANSRCLSLSLVDDQKGHVFMSGHMQGGFSVGAATIPAMGGLGIRSYLLRFDEDGTVPVARSIGDDMAINTGDSLALGPNGNIWYAGNSFGKIDLQEPGQPYPALSPGFVTVSLFDVNGKHLRSTRLGNTKDGFIFRIESDGDKRMWLSGGFFGSFSPSGDGKNSLVADDNYRDIFLAGYEL
jgi:hypothetical protein